jgi:hypothetical protein
MTDKKILYFLPCAVEIDKNTKKPAYVRPTTCTQYLIMNATERPSGIQSLDIFYNFLLEFYNIIL